MDDLYKIVNGKRVKLKAAEKTAREAEEAAFEATRKDKAIEQAEQLYKDKKAKREIEVDGVIYDLSDSFEFDYQRKSGGDVRVKVKDGKTESKTKQDTDAIETALFAYLNSVADAFDADMDAIEAGDYSLSHLRGI
jgi:hypothetical protein